MFVRSLKMHLFLMLRKKSAIFVYLSLLVFVLINFFTNMLQNYNIGYISQMLDPIKMLTLSDISPAGFFLMNLFPLLVVIPTASSYLTERDTGVRVYIQSKTGNLHYWYGKLLAVFIVTFIIFTIPFLLEIALNVICFSLKSHGDPSNSGYYETIVHEDVYLFSEILFKNRILYGVVMTLLFGAASGIIACFNFSLTTLHFFKYKILTFFPVYVLFYLVDYLQVFFKIDQEISYFFALRMYNLKTNYHLFGLFLLCLLTFSLIMIGIKIKRDDTL